MLLGRSALYAAGCALSSSALSSSARSSDEILAPRGVADATAPEGPILAAEAAAARAVRAAVSPAARAYLRDDAHALRFVRTPTPAGAVDVGAIELVAAWCEAPPGGGGERARSRRE